MRYKVAAWFVFVALALTFMADNIRSTSRSSFGGPTTTAPVTLPLPTQLDVVVDGALRSGQTAAFEVGYTNRTGQPIAVVFPTSQDADVALLQGGQVRWRWSDGLSFTQALRTVRFADGRTALTLAPRPLDVPAGEYTAIATLSGQPAPTAVGIPVTVG